MNIRMVWGETLALEVEVVDEDGIGVDLTDFTLVFRTTWGVERSTQEDDIVVNGSTAQFVLLPSDTLSLPRTRMRDERYELKGRSPAGVVRQIVAGQLQVRPSVIEAV
jgi:hypothetical protein